MKKGYVSSPEGKPTAEQMKKINNYSKKELQCEEVYVFETVLCDNEVDREFEAFATESLEGLGMMFEGRTGILDHSCKSTDQVARIFECFVKKFNHNNSYGEQYAQLHALAYIPRIDSAAQIIKQIESGIKKEVSVSCAVGERRCSVCGKAMHSCEHIPGAEYETDNGSQRCFAKLYSPIDAYEFSFVAVPCQPKAGVIKQLQNEPDTADKQFEQMVKQDAATALAAFIPAVNVKIFAQMVKPLTAEQLGELNRALKSKTALKSVFEVTLEKGEAITNYTIN